MSLGVDRVAVYDLDDNAAAHPRYDAIMRARGIRGHDAVTQNLPPNLGLRCLEHVRGGDPKYDVVASAPLHLEDGTKIWVDGFRARGYRVALVYVTTNEANSLLGCLANRYQQARDDAGIGRWVAPAAGRSGHRRLQLLHLRLQLLHVPATSRKRTKPCSR
jgi:hypothetical protein